MPGEVIVMGWHLGPLEIVLIVVIFLIIFGAGRLPQVFEFLGKGLRFIYRGRSDEEEKGVEATGKSRKKAARKTDHD
jgi:sec-independent protein translocase protein TatA